MNTERRKKDGMFAILFGIILSYWTYRVVLSQLPGILNDYNGHVYVYLPMFSRKSFLEFWQAVPYFMWHGTVMFFNKIIHIPLEVSAAYTSCLFALFSYFVMYWAIGRVLLALNEADNGLKAAILAFCLSIEQGLYCFWLDDSFQSDRFLGLYSMNPIHNPTYMCMLGFSILCMCLVYDIWGRQKDENYQGIFFRVEQGLKKYYIILSFILFCSVFAKPTFAEMFIPAVGILMLWNWIAAIRKKDGSGAVYFKHCLHMLYCALPSLFYILIEYLNYFVFGGSYGSEDAHVIITRCMQVWSSFSENVVLSIALGLAFPLFIVLLDPAFFVKKDLGRLAVIGYLVGLFEAAFLGESEPKLYHADFIWPMMSGMMLMFMASTLRLLVLEKKYANTNWKQFLIYAAWFLFGLHALCGYLLIKDVIGVF